MCQNSNVTVPSPVGVGPGPRFFEVGSDKCDATIDSFIDCEWEVSRRMAVLITRDFFCCDILIWNDILVSVVSSLSCLAQVFNCDCGA